MIMTSVLTFKVFPIHYNQSATCIASYPLTTGGSKQSSATTQPLDVQCEMLIVCFKVPVCNIYGMFSLISDFYIGIGIFILVNTECTAREYIYKTV